MDYRLCIIIYEIYSLYPAALPGPDRENESFPLPRAGRLCSP